MIYSDTGYKTSHVQLGPFVEGRDMGTKLSDGIPRWQQRAWP